MAVTKITYPEYLENVHYNLGIEKHVVGTFLEGAMAISMVDGFLKPEMFYDTRHTVIIETILSMYAGDLRDSIALNTVYVQLSKRGLLEVCGGLDYISDCANWSVGMIERNAIEVKHLYTKREFVKMCHKAIHNAKDIDTDFDMLLENHQQNILELSLNNVNDSIKSLGELASTQILELEKLSKTEGFTGVPSGFIDLDNITGGFKNGNLIIIGARPSMGKTTLVANLALNATTHGKKVAIFSIEESALEITNKFISMQSNVPNNRLRDGKGITPEEWATLSNTAEIFEPIGIFIDDTPAIELSQLRAKARFLKQCKDVDMIIIDYLQLVVGASKYGDRHQEVANVVVNIKAIARELNIPIICLAQVNRANESRTDKRPLTSDLAESGKIEQAADLLFFLFRPAFYGILETENGHSTKGLTELIIRKHRNGATGTVMLNLQPETSKFTDVESDFNTYLVPANAAKSDNTKPQRPDLKDVPF